MRDANSFSLLELFNRGQKPHPSIIYNNKKYHIIVISKNLGQRTIILPMKKSPVRPLNDFLSATI